MGAWGTESYSNDETMDYIASIREARGKIGLGPGSGLSFAESISRDKTLKKEIQKFFNSKKAPFVGNNIRHPGPVVYAIKCGIKIKLHIRKEACKLLITEYELLASGHNELRWRNPAKRLESIAYELKLLGCTNV